MTEYFVDPFEQRLVAGLERYGQFAGFVGRAIYEQVAGDFVAPAETMPPVGEAYMLPSVDEMIAAELERNPTERVLAKGSRDGIRDDNERYRYQVAATGSGPGMLSIDCVGSAEALVVVGRGRVTNPCLALGSYQVAANVHAGDVINVYATGDTTWRVVCYGCQGCSVP